MMTPKPITPQREQVQALQGLRIAAAPMLEAPPGDLQFDHAASGSSHGAQVWASPSTDTSWMVKKTPPGKKYRATGETAANQLATRSGLVAPPAFTTDIDGAPASVQKMFSGAHDAFPDKDVDIDALSDDDMSTIGKHHALDWLLSNHDSHPGQFIRDADGALIGIDKGQAYRYVNGDALDWNFHPNAAYGETEPIYNTLYRNFAHGGRSPADPRSGDLGAYIQGLQNIPDDEFRSMLSDYAIQAAQAGRLATDTDYRGATGQQFAPNDPEAFLSAMVNRKNSLGADMGALYDRALAARAEQSRTAATLRQAGVGLEARTEQVGVVGRLPTSEVADYFNSIITPDDLDPDFDADVRANGVRTPIEISTDGVRAHITDGHHRTLSAQGAGLPDVPVHVYRVAPWVYEGGEVGEHLSSMLQDYPKAVFREAEVKVADRKFFDGLGKKTAAAAPPMPAWTRRDDGVLQNPLGYEIRPTHEDERGAYQLWNTAESWPPGGEQAWAKIKPPSDDIDALKEIVDGPERAWRDRKNRRHQRWQDIKHRLLGAIDPPLPHSAASLFEADPPLPSRHRVGATVDEDDPFFLQQPQKWKDYYRTTPSAYVQDANLADYYEVAGLSTAGEPGYPTTRRTPALRGDRINPQGESVEDRDETPRPHTRDTRLPPADPTLPLNWDPHGLGRTEPRKPAPIELWRGKRIDLKDPAAARIRAIVKGSDDQYNPLSTTPNTPRGQQQLWTADPVLGPVEFNKTHDEDDWPAYWNQHRFHTDEPKADIPASFESKQLGPQILDYLSGDPHSGSALGRHWSLSNAIADDYAGTTGGESPIVLNNPDILPVRMRADWPGLGEDTQRTNTGFDYPNEQEITMVPGAPLDVQDVQVWHPDNENWVSVLDASQRRSAATTHLAAEDFTKELGTSGVPSFVY